MGCIPLLSNHSGFILQVDLSLEEYTEIAKF